MLLEAALFVLFLLLFRAWWLTDRGENMPPGPTIYPIVGSKYVKKVQDARDMQRKYGNIVRTRMGQSEIVLLCDYKIIKEAFLKMEFADRPNWRSFHILTEGREAGVIFTNGQRWHNARRFLLRNLRELGMGKNQLDVIILEEAKVLVEEFKKFDGKASPPPKCINIAVLNVIWQMVASRRYDLNDAEIADFLRVMKSLHEDSTNIILPDIFPIINYLPNFIKKVITKEELVKKAVAKARAIMEENIEIHKQELDRNHPKDVIDEYLVEMDKEDSDIGFFFSEDDLMRTTFDLFGAGFDTTASTLRWMILYMAAHPEVQQKVQREIDSVVPRDKLPSHQERASLPYLDAAIHEVLRKSSLIPFALHHATTTDTTLRGFIFPRGTNVVGCSALVHEDPRLWPNPHKFEPERFLDLEGKFTSPREGFIPFGIGKRQCLGEALARMELYVFSAALLQNFTFSPHLAKQ